MKKITLNLFLSTLILTCAQTNCSTIASDNEEDFCGFGRGFLNITRKKENSSNRKRKPIVPKEKQQQKPAKYHFWEDPQYSPIKHLSRTPVLNLWERTDKYYLERKTFPIEPGSLTLENSLPIIYQFFIALQSHESNVFRNLNFAANTDEIPSNDYSFLIEGDRIIKYLLQNPKENSPLHPGATNDHGVLTFRKDFWKESEKRYNAGHRYEEKNPPQYSYYSFRDSKNQLRYVIYDSKILKKIKFKGATYFLGEGLVNLIAESKESTKSSGLRLAQNTFILDESMKLVPPRGQLTIMQGKPFELDVAAHAYIQDPKTGMPYLVQLSEKPENSYKISEDLGFLIDMIGNRETLEECKFLFSDLSVFSSEAPPCSGRPSHDTFTPDKAVAFLRYALPMLETYEKTPQALSFNEKDYTRDLIKEKLSEAVENATKVLIESQYKEVFEQEIENIESQNYEIDDQTLEDKIKVEVEKFTKTRNQTRPNETTKTRKKAIKRKKTKLKEKYKKKASKKQKKESLPAAKEKTYRIIHEEILKDLRGKRHLSTSQMKECLGRLVDGFLQENDSHLSIDTHVMKGDHGGTKIINLDSGHKGTVSLGLRPQRKGYKVGTARKIIGDNFEKLLNLALKTKVSR